MAQAALPGQIAAATVDHGLRAESAGEAAMVAEFCGELGVPHATLAVTLAPGNLQAEARAARYAALAGWMAEQGLSALATAHHADDQAETLLLRLGRGSGVAGLAGVRASGTVPGTNLALLRPLLGWRRAELAAVVAAAGMTAVQDPSNRIYASTARDCARRWRGRTGSTEPRSPPAPRIWPTPMPRSIGQQRANGPNA